MGEEKGLTLFRGKPMIQYLLDVGDQLGVRHAIIGHHSGYHDFGVPVYGDLILDQGPLGGIYTALINCQTSQALILSCDTPLIKPETLEKFIELKGEEISVGVLSDKINPFPGIYPKTILPKLLKSLEQNRLRVQGFILENAHHLISLEKISSNPNFEFSNFNSPKDLLLLEQNKTEL